MTYYIIFKFYYKLSQISNASKNTQKLFYTLIISFSFFSAAQQQPIPDWVKDIGGTAKFGSYTKLYL
jgi:hypothetical protein